MGDQVVEKYWNAIMALYRHIHVVHRKIFATKITSVHEVLRGIGHASELSVDYLAIGDMATSMNISLASCDDTQFARSISNTEARLAVHEGFLLSYKLPCKSGMDCLRAVAVVDIARNTFVMKFESEVFDDFAVTVQDGELVVRLLSQRAPDDRSTRWLEYILKPKLLKWGENKAGEKTEGHIASLQHIDAELYIKLYTQLKRKYSVRAHQLWQNAKESTDPAKFINEDLAIAAYLISLWSQRGHNEPIFADLGCGNGLLVYILSEEGYRGYGYDVRARKLWPLYPAKLQLIEEAINPNNFQLPTDVTWLIGNHSDELSPWVPVLAANAGYNVNYFLLPCCPFELSGMKFQRRRTSCSAYQDFIDYAHYISSQCGCKTIVDRLTIPSTKRIAIIGIGRQYGEDQYSEVLLKLNNFVAAEIQKYQLGDARGEVKLRTKIELVRNCTQIDKAPIDRLVLKVFHILLSPPNYPGDVGTPTQVWNEGRPLSLLNIVQSLDRSDLQLIKMECGGLKTLLRNKHEIFEFHKQGLVGLRKPSAARNIERQKLGKPLTVKKRLCFFAAHHPQGCPLSARDCTFLHSEQDAS